MAEKRFIKGLFKDTGHIDQPEGSWRHAHNSFINDKKGSITNEGGTDLAGHLGDDPIVGAQNDKVIGIIEVDGDRAVFFVTDVMTAVNPRSEIGIWENGVYRTLYNPAAANFPEHDLNFREAFPIEGTFKVDSKGDLIVYWTDDNNPPRAFNITRQIRFIETGSPINSLYGITSLNSINLLNLFPHAGAVPHIYIADIFWGTPPYQNCVQEGGGLRTGVYYLALAYVDDDFVATNFLTVSNPISIVDEFDKTRPTTKKDGIKEGSQTSKSITWRINNMNTDYSYMRPVVIRKMGDAVDAFKLNDVEISPNLAPTPFQEIIFSGIEGFESASVEEVIIDTVAYDTAKTINQLDGVLYVGNLTASKDVGFQKYANNIKLNSIIRTIDPFDEYWATVDNLTTGFGNSAVDEGNTVNDTHSYRYIPNIFKWKGYMRDEIYAFYIAFILNDGSMSYAYHIPGRSELEDQDYTHYNVLGAFNNAPETNKIPGAYREFYREDAKLYQFYDLSANNVGSNSNAGGSCRHMQYWENFTELYPNTDNFEVWDETGDMSNDLKRGPVRHHHFPSNENQDRKTITDNDSVVLPTVSIWTPPNTSHYEGEYAVCVDNGHNGGTFWMNDTWAATMANVGRINLGGTICINNPTGTNTTVPHDTSHNQHCFVATSPNTQVEVRCNYKMFNDHPYCDQWGTVRVRANVSGTTITVPLDLPNNTAPCSHDYFQGANDLVLRLGNSGSNDTRVMNSGGYAWTIANLDPGDTVWMEGMGTQIGNAGCTSGGSTMRRIDISDHCNCVNNCSYGSSGSWAGFRVTIIPPGTGDYHDVDVKHKIRPLGFELEDVKIPQDIADKVQGFRIFRSKRNHSNKTIVGQDIGKPMLKKSGILGICLECAGSADAMQGLQTLGAKQEAFYLNSAYSKDASLYTTPTQTTQNDQGQAYKTFSFHDFHLLRTHNSLAPVTHIKAEYIVGDYTWNGPDIEQDKKMLSEIDTTGAVADNGLYKITERWGWDLTGAPPLGPQNCYPREINSALFIGGEYMSTGDTSISGHNMHTTNYELNRPIGQKAKSYVIGNTIFDGNALGFGGKIGNNYGESHIAFGLRDDHELPALTSILDVDGSGTTDNDPTNLWGIFNEDYNFMLTTLTTNELTDDDHARHKSYLLNLKSFKTDLYKSIDSNELVWTGFEVLGDDLENYIFDDNGNLSGTCNTIDTHPDGIWGGDTYISRYGTAKGVTPMDDTTLSNPEKGVYYHILESPDNVNFRHSDSAQHAYFPLTPAKRCLKYVGMEDNDFTEEKKMLYNKNYSAVNDIRVAFPLPLRETQQDDFPTRAHRSAKADPTSLIDNWRIFLANQFKDLPKNRGELWKLSSFNNLLYFHMEESLFAAQGKQTMSMKDGSEAFVGSGDIFTQEANEMIQTKGGFGGTTSQWAAITTRHGYFFIDADSKKVFLMKDQLLEISQMGMETWFRDNLSFNFSSYGLNVDNPLIGLGFLATWDPKYKRIILSKRDLEGTDLFNGLDEIVTNSGLFHYIIPYIGGQLPSDIQQMRFNTVKQIWERAAITFAGNPPVAIWYWKETAWTHTGYFKDYGPNKWTISYYPELGIWASFHDYVPYIYFKTSTNFYSLTDDYARPCYTNSTTLNNWVGTTFGNAGIWKHNSDTWRGILYQENTALVFTDEEWLTRVDYHDFEFEYIHNETKSDDTLYSSISYTLETFDFRGAAEEVSVLEHGFTSFYLYNTMQMSPEQDLEYLINVRRVGNNWKIHKFRDMADIALDNTSPGYYMSTNTNIIGGTNVGTITTSSTINMFIYAGMTKRINNNYLNLAKPWNEQRKFIDKWLGIRLIYNNISNNLLNLYSTNVEVRKMYR